MKSICLFSSILIIKFIVSDGFDRKLCDCVRTNPLPDTNPTERNTNKTNDSRGAFEYVVRLLSEEPAGGTSNQQFSIFRPFCTGILLSADFILTAGNCAHTCNVYIKDKKNTYAVAGGITKDKHTIGKTRLTSLIEQRKLRKIEKVFEQDMIDGIGKNVALVKVEDSFILGDSTSTYPACLIDIKNANYFNVGGDYLAYIAGYGISENKEGINDSSTGTEDDKENLRSILSFEIVRCDDKLISQYVSESFCLKSIGKKGFCVSGNGAAYFQYIPLDENEFQRPSFFALGIYNDLSVLQPQGSKEDCSPNKTETFTQIYPYIPWIKKTIDGEFCNFELKRGLMQNYAAPIEGKNKKNVLKMIHTLLKFYFKYVS